MSGIIKSNMKNEIKTSIISLKDESYKNFHSKLCPGTTNILGVRVPVLRNYAKELIKNYQVEDLLKNIDNEYYEEIMLKGLLIGLNKSNDLNKTINYIKDFIPLINNWAICDTFCAGLKITKKTKKEMRKFILSYKNSKKEFELRFMIVMILDYYIEEAYLEDNFKIFSRINQKDYYVEMALAWAISICLIKYYDQTLTLLDKYKFSDFVYNKSLQKACESYRISNKKKLKLKSMKR